MADVVLANTPTSAVGANANRQVAPLTLPPNVRSLGEAPPIQVQTLQRQLQINQQRYIELDSYFRGDHRHSFDSVRFQQAFGRQLRNFADNWLRLVVSATVNRLSVQGFRVGATDVEGTSDVDQAAWGFWTANRLGQASTIAHRDAMKFGKSFIMVDPLTPPNQPPKITVESPYQVIGQRDALNRYQLINAIKKWIGDDGFQYLNYYTPDVVLKFRAAAATQSAVPNDPGRILQTPSWFQIDEVANPLGVVPLVPLENQPDLIDGGMSDLDDLIPLNDALNKVLRDMLVASEYQGFRQRWATGVDVPKDPLTGKPITDHAAQLKAAQSNVWMFPGPAVKVGDFAQVDLTPYTSAIEMLVHQISQVSMTPSYMIVGKLANLSADAIRAAELGFVGKLVSKQSDFGVGWEHAMQLALQARGLADPTDPVEVMWADAAANSGSILANELAIMAKLGLPRAEVFRRYGYSPMVIAEWERTNAFQETDPAGASQISPGPMDQGNSAPDG